MHKKLSREQVEARIADARRYGTIIDLQGADLSALDLRGMNLSNAMLVGTNLRGTNLRGAILCDAAIRIGSLRRALR